MTNGCHSVACGLADGRRGSALITSLLQKAWTKTPFPSCLLDTTTFGEVATQFGGFAGEYGGPYPSSHLAVLEKTLADWQAKSAGCAKLPSGFESELATNRLISVGLKIVLIARGGVGSI
jgi:hypothetical protein